MYYIVYTMGNLFMSYVINKFMSVFYNESRVSNKIQISAYFTYFIVITLVYIMIKIPIVIAITNLISLFALTFLYDNNIRKAVLSTVLIYVTLACAETLAVLITNYTKIDLLNPYNYNLIFGVILARVICFAFALAFHSFKNIKAGTHMQRIYWISLIVVPLGTMLLLFSSLLGDNLPKSLTIIIIIVTLLINVITFYLYDSISIFMEEKMSKRLADEQNKYYENQLRLMEKSLDNTKKIRHDLKNKLSPIYDLAINKKNQELIEKLSELTDFCTLENEYSKSGNVAIDSILNFKLQKVKKDNIDVSCDILIPKNFEMSPFDIANILGNLVDNALEGVYTLNKNRWIDIKIKYSKGRLFITINNSFDGIIIQNNGNLVTRKSVKESHGIGLKSVQDTIDKYNGYMDIEYDEEKFKAKVLIYI